MALAGCVTEKVLDEDSYRANLDAYHTAQRIGLDRFKRDLFKDLGIERNKRREKLYAVAWERGHAHGLQDVYAVACDLVDLIKD